MTVTAHTQAAQHACISVASVAVSATARRPSAAWSPCAHISVKHVIVYVCVYVCV
jgi:hypothetical protein